MAAPIIHNNNILARRILHIIYALLDYSCSSVMAYLQIDLGYVYRYSGNCTVSLELLVVRVNRSRWTRDYGKISSLPVFVYVYVYACVSEFIPCVRIRS